MRTLSSALLLLIAAGAAPGCSLLVDADASRLHPWREGGTADAEPQPDADRDGTIAPSDADLPDADADMPPPEADAGIQPPQDAGVPTPDSSIPAGPGCLDGTVDQPYLGRSDIVGCDGARNQCEAQTLCGTGWHLCSYDEFLARGADVTATTIRWVAGCVRSFCSLDVMAVSPDICGDCESGEAMLPLAVSFACGAGRPTAEIACDVGVAAHTNPLGRRIATSATRCLQAEAFPTRETYGATCCW